MISIGRQIVIDYQDLIDEHDEIDRLSRQLEALVVAPPDRDRAQTVLRQLAAVVAAHLRKEEGFIYPGLANCADHGEATALVEEFESMKAAWERYLETWQEEGALHQWQRFGAESVAMLQDLRERALKEVGQLYAVGLREGLVALRPAMVEAQRQAGSR